MLSVWRGPVRCELARLEPVFTQPLRPDWEALFSHPGAFQRKPPAEAPRLRHLHQRQTSRLKPPGGEKQWGNPPRAKRPSKRLQLMETCNLTCSSEWPCLYSEVDW
ncbi:hypothetical protein NQZ68_003991 [Dissostichus eleginoides]|nr:hypothetical protein NQZ68_003991 [Dissostichus eleginoides]